MKLTEAEWSVLDALWEKKEASLKELTDALEAKQSWSKISPADCFRHPGCRPATPCETSV